MAGQVGKLTLEAVIKGFDDVQGLGKALKQVQGIANQSDASFKNITTRVKEFARQNVKTTDSIRGQIAAFTRLRGSVGVASNSYTALTKNIQELRRELVSLDTAEEKRGKKDRLRRMGFSDAEIRREMRTQSQLIERATSGRVYDQTTRGIRQGILDQRVSDAPMMLKGKVNREYVDSFLEAARENNEFTALQNRLNLRLEAQLAQSQVKSQFATPKVLGPEDDRRFIKRTPRYPGEYGPIFDPTNKDIFTKIIRGSLGVMGEAFPGRKGVGLTGFKPGFTADPDARDYPEDWIKDWKRPMDVARQIVDRRMGGGKRRTSLRTQWGDNLRDDIFVPENVRKWETHSERLLGQSSFKGKVPKGTKLLGAGYDTWAGGKRAADAPIFYSDIATGDVRARGGRLGKMVGGPSKDLGPSYPQTPAGDAANIAALNKQLVNLKTNSDGAKKVREKLLEIENRMSREMRKAQGTVGDLTRKEAQRVRVQEKLAKRQAEYGGDGKVGSRDPLTGAMIAGGSGSFRMPVPTQVREVSNLYNQIANIGMSKINADIDRMGKSYEEVRKDILAASKAGNNSVQSLNAQKSAFVQLRDGMNPASKGFKQLTKDIQNTDKALMRLSANKFSGANLRRTGQSILGAGFVGGPAGFLGAGIGAGVEALRPGGDMAGGAITGGLVASQVLTPISQAIGGATEYAADYKKSEKTLKLITKDAGSYGVAMEAVKTAVEEYNVPQEVAIKGMTRLSAAVLGSGGNINNAAEAFLNTTAAIKGTAGSADDVKSAITAMVQIYSKGKVSAEELSGQLGERFPAAVTRFADANNISTQELQKNLKDGTVGLDMLSKFVESLGTEYAPLAKKIAASNEEAGARSRVAMNKLRIAVGETLIPVGKEFQEIGANLVLDLIPALTKLAQIGGDAFAALASSISFVVDNFNIIGPAIAGATASLVAYNIQQQITNKTGIAKILIQAWAAMTKLVAAIKAGTVAQVALNAVTAINPYVALAGVITSVATAIWGVKAASDALKGEETLLGDISGMTLKETKKTLKEVESTLKMYQDIINNPDTAESTRKGLNSYIDKLETQIADLQTQIKKLGGKFEYPGQDGSGGEDAFSGLRGGWEKFADSVKNSGEEIANITASWFDRAADALSEFVMTGKLKFKEFARSIIADIAKMIAKQMIFNVIAGLGGKGGGIGGFISGLFGGGGKKTTTVAQVTGVATAKGGVFAQNGIVPYAKGGIVNSPTLFPFAKGVGLMGEAGPEAIMPLKRGKGGRLGVEGGGGATTVNVAVDAKGTKVEGDGKQMAQLGKMLGSAIEMEIAKQKRPGGLLA